MTEFHIDLPAFTLSLEPFEGRPIQEQMDWLSSILYFPSAVGLGPYFAIYTDDDLAAKAVESLNSDGSGSPRVYALEIDHVGELAYYLIYHEAKGIRHVVIDADPSEKSTGVIVDFKTFRDQILHGE